MHFLTKKRALGALATFAALAVAGVAFAYFTTTGKGEGEAKVGTSAELTIHGAISESLYPGTTAKVVFTVDNSSTGHQYVGKIKLTKVEAFKDLAHKEPLAGCEESWFKMTEVTENEDVASGNGISLSKEGTLEFKNEAVSQDSCKNAYLVAKFTSN